MPSFYVDPDAVQGKVAGDVFTNSDGRRYKIVTKTTTAVAADRYFWFDALTDWLLKRVGKDASKDKDV